MTLHEDTNHAGAVVALLERGVGRAVPKRDNAGAQRIVARESAGAGGFDSRSLAEIVVKDGVRVPDEAQAFSECCTVVMQRPDSRERPAPTTADAPPFGGVLQRAQRGS